jgi:hypothetical protein
MVSLNPIPVIKRKDYVMYLLRMNKAYEIFPKENHDYIDEIAYDYRRYSNDWEEILKCFEEKDHPVRGYDYQTKSRYELFLDSLTIEEKRVLDQETYEKDNDDYQNHETFLRTFDKTYEDEVIGIGLAKFKKHPFVSTSPKLRYLANIADGTETEQKSYEELEQEEEQEFEDFYKDWKAKLAEKVKNNSTE